MNNVSDISLNTFGQYKVSSVSACCIQMKTDPFFLRLLRCCNIFV